MLNKRIPENPRYRHVKPVVDTGESLLFEGQNGPVTDQWTKGTSQQASKDLISAINVYQWAWSLRILRLYMFFRQLNL